MNSRYSHNFAPRPGTPILVGWALFVAIALVVLAAVARAQQASDRPNSGQLPVNEVMAGVSLAQGWRFKAGDDASWADPELNDAAWQTVSLPHRWRHGEVPLPAERFGWYRVHLKFAVQDDAQRKQLAQLGLRLGGVLSAYEVYAGGQQVGGVGKLPPVPEPAIDFDRKTVVPIPPSAITAEGEMVIALRVWGGDGVLFDYSGGGPWSGKFELGRYSDQLMTMILAQTPGLLISAFCMLFGTYYLYLYSRNRQLASFLWLGLLALDIGLYGLTLNQWRYYLGWDFTILKKLEYTTVYLIPPLALQSLWSLLDQPIGRWLRTYQVLLLVIALVLPSTPGLEVHFATLSAWQIFILPALGLIIWLILSKALQGHAEARTIALGALLFAAACLNDIAIDLFDYHSTKLLLWGFLAILLSMAVSLGNRLTGMLNRLEEEVAERTAELSEANLRLFEAARIDPLTGLLNRRGFTAEVETEIQRVSRSGRSFSVVLADIDHFKSINDRYGHACGDYVLTRTAANLCDCVRYVDRVSRWGGEEFILLLPETDSDGAAVLAEKLRQTVADHLFQFEGARLSVTMTFGVASFRKGESLDSCTARADTALYQGKKEGRNTVVVGNSKS